ncbi:MAG: DNA polymerase I [actinobacterium acIB-AMD-7]|nr:MAG: DNA polymerase I [actinobacterium acIB-AMD-7]
MSVVEKRLLLIDGHSMAYRAFYALPAENFKTSSGQPTNAVYGFASMLINLIKEEKPTHIAVAFDVSRKTFRSEKFPEYKANRSATPDEFRSQLSFINELVDGFGIKHLEMPGFEADDIIATLSKQAEEQDFEILICTGDRDSFQLVSKSTTVLYPKKGVTEMNRMTPDSVFEKYGLTAQQYPDFAALRGDPSDNLPSVPGVGEKTATKWIADYGSLNNLLENSVDIGGKVGESLRANIDSVRLNRELTQLVSDLQLSSEIKNLEWLGINIAEISKFFEKLEIRALKERVKSLPQIGGQSTNEIEIGVRQLNSKEINDLLLNRKDPIAVSVEIQEGKVISYSVALSESEVIDSSDISFGDWILDPQLPKYVHGAKKLLKVIKLDGLIADIELLAYLVNPGSRNLELTDLAQRLLGISESSQSLFSDFNPKSAAWIYRIYNELQNEITTMGMNSLYTEIEQPTLLLLSKMESIGIAVDKEELKSLATHFSQIVSDQTKLAYKEAGHEFNVSSPKQLQAVLFDELNLPKTKKIKTGFTTDAESLDWLFAKTQHPILKNLLRIRETGKLLTTIEGLITATDSKDRIHTNFQQTVAATGRLSSTEPNLQNIPIRTEEGRKIRNCFVAQKPYVNLMTADYSQIEMRIMAHFSNDQGLIKAFESGEDLHSTVASQVFDVQANEVDAEMRRTIKAMSYGLAYGLSSFGLAQQLDIDPAAANTLMSKYFERFGGIQDYLKTVVVKARENGYTQTILGRRRYLPDLNNENRQRREVAERAALNAPIQGSAADIIKIAMLNVDTEITKHALKSRLLLQVHDELILEVAQGEEDKLKEIVSKQMANAYKLNVPLDVNIGIGNSWDLAAH